MNLNCLQLSESGTHWRWRRAAELAQTLKGDVRGSLDDFEVKVRRYERTCGEVLSDRVKIAVVQKGIEDEDLRRHLLMHAKRLFVLQPRARGDSEDHHVSRHPVPAPMDVNAVHKGKGKGKGKGKRSKGKGKWKDEEAAVNPDAEVICYYCHRKGHRKRDCRKMEKREAEEALSSRQLPKELRQVRVKRQSQHESA